MQNYKVNELITIDKIRGIIEWIYENVDYLQIEPEIKDRINDILNGKRFEPYIIGYGVIIEDSDGRLFDAVKYTYELRSKFFARCLPMLEYSIKKINAKKLKETHRIVKTKFFDAGVKEVKELNHIIINKEFQLFMSQKIIEFYEKEFKSSNGFFYQKFKEELDELKRISNIATEFNTNFIKNFCTENNVGDKIVNIFYAISNTHLELGLWTIYSAKSVILDNTQYKSIVKERRTLYKKTIGIRPEINGFYLYLLSNKYSLIISLC